MYMGFGGKMAWHEFPEPEITSTANDNLLRGYLVKGSAYESKLEELRSRNLSPATVEIIRRHRQISFAVLGFDAELYPCCVYQESLQHNTKGSPKRQLRQRQYKSTVTTSKRFVRIWSESRESHFATDLGPETTRVINYIHRLLRSFPDPVSFHSNELEKQFVRNMAMPTYLDALEVNNVPIANDDVIGAIIENDVD
jgi:hypothetical protein